MAEAHLQGGFSDNESAETSELSGAKWIAPNEPLTAARIYKSFDISALPKSAVIYITGLGYFEATVNGIPLTDDRLIPPASDYFKRDLSKATYPTTDEFTHRIYYHKFDISDKLKLGENRLEVTLGGGWLTLTDRIAEGELSYYDRPMCAFNINLADNVNDSLHYIYSDGAETYSECEIRRSRLFFGEDWDLGYKGQPKPITVIPTPKSILSPAIGQNDKIIREISPRLIFEENGRRVYDAGENISGLVRLVIHAPRGEKYTLSFSEDICESELKYESTGSFSKSPSGEAQIMRDTVISGGERSEFMPKFTWHAFRYFELLGNMRFVDEVTVCVIHAATLQTAEFSSDIEGANFLFDAYIRTQLSNLHGSFPSDCPHRERLGYTGDGQITAASSMMMLDSRELYAKWIRDIMDCQDKKTGHIQHTAPFGGGGGGPGGWGSAIITVPYAYYKQFADPSPVLDALPAMKRYLEFCRSCSEGGLVVRELDGGWCLGDWCMQDSGKLPEPFVNTCWLIHSARLYLELSDHLLGKSDPEIEAALEHALVAVKKEYRSLSHIGAAMAYAAWIGIESPSAAAEYYDKLGHFDTGFLGTDILGEVLIQNSYGRVFAKLLSSEKNGSFLYMKRRGATTIWERWHGIKNCSKSHPMFGAISRQLFSGILGIRQSAGSYGYESIAFKPYLPDGATYASGSILTPRGRITVNLKRCGDKVFSDIKLPDGIKLISE